MTLSPHVDWRRLAEIVKDWPPCKHCGQPFGNLYFGAVHYDKHESARAECPGYEPDPTKVAGGVSG